MRILVAKTGERAYIEVERLARVCFMKTIQ